MARLALIEDDAVHARLLTEALATGGHDVRLFADPAQFFRAAATLRPAALVLDWGLPGMNGGRVIARARQLFGHGMPVLVVTAAQEEAVVLEALALDADDFVHKPVSPVVLRARLAAVLRRRAKDQRDPDVLCSHPPYRLDRRRQALSRDGQPLMLTPREFDLAWLLFSNPDRFVSRAELLAGVWGLNTDVATHTLAQHVHSLRRKLDLAGHGYQLRNVYGAGYRLLAPADAAAEAAGAEAPAASLA